MVRGRSRSSTPIFFGRTPAIFPPGIWVCLLGPQHEALFCSDEAKDKETPESFLVEMAAPGMEKKDFKIELDGSALTISSEKQNESVEKDGENYNRKEFSFQSFYRTFHLPKDVVNADKIKAKYENGLLRLEIPKREEAKQKPARLIDIQ